MNIKKITKFLDNQLKIKEVDDISLNGIQVEGKSEIQKIGLAVDADVETIKKAILEKIDLLIVHHGLFWKDNEKIVSYMRERIKLLLENNITLYAVHLPLDIHEEFGNNLQLSKLLNLRDIHEIKIDDLVLGYSGFSEYSNLKDLVDFINLKLNTHSRLYNYGEELIRRVAVSSGAGGFIIKECIENGMNTLITGEIHYEHQVIAKDMKINVIEAGHYQTETLGIKALGKNLEKIFNIETKFININ